MKLIYWVATLILILSCVLVFSVYKYSGKLSVVSHYDTLVSDADLAMQDAHWLKAASLYEKALDIKKADLNIKLREAQAYQYAGDPIKANEIYKAITENAPSGINEEILQLAKLNQARLTIARDSEKSVPPSTLPTVQDYKPVTLSAHDVPKDINLSKVDLQENLKPENRVNKSLAEDQRKVIESEVLAWAKSWEKKDLDGYFSYYVKGYKGNMKNSKLWTQNRKERILNVQKLKITISDIKIKKIDKKSVEVTFTQSYQSSTHNHRDKKALVLKMAKDRWLISKELIGSKLE